MDTYESKCEMTLSAVTTIMSKAKKLSIKEQERLSELILWTNGKGERVDHEKVIDLIQQVKRGN